MGGPCGDQILGMISIPLVIKGLMYPKIKFSVFPLTCRIWMQVIPHTFLSTLSQIIILYRKTAYNTLKYAVDTIAHYRADILYLPH